MSKKDKFLAAAQKYLERGSLDKALGEFQRAVQEDPKDTRTWLRIAEIHVKRGENEEATGVYLKTAGLYVEQGFFQRAVAVYKNVLKLSPGHVEAYFKLADIYKQLGVFSDAAQQYEQAANVLQKAGRLKEAVQALQHMVELNPEQVMTRIKLAELASRGGFVDDAIREFGRAADQLEGQGRVDEYLRVAERLLFHQPGNLALAKKVAGKYLERGNPKFALAKLQECFNATPKDVETLTMLATAFEQLGQTAKTVSVLRELVKVYDERRQVADRNFTVQRILALEPSDPEANAFSERISYVGPAPKLPPPREPSPPFGNLRGAPSSQPKISPFPPARSQAEQRPRAITFTGIAVPEFMQAEITSSSFSAPLEAPETPTPALPLATTGAPPSPPEEDVSGEVRRILAEADVFVKYGLVERAADHLRKVFDLAPDHVDARERLAAVLLQLGRRPEAVAELEALAERLLGDGDREEAERHARRALEVEPGSTRARAVLDRLSRPEAPAVPVPSLDDASDEADFIDDIEEIEAEELSDSEVMAVDMEAVPEALVEEDTLLEIEDSTSYEDLEVQRAPTPAHGSTNPVAAPLDLSGDLPELDALFDDKLTGPPPPSEPDLPALVWPAEERPSESEPEPTTMPDLVPVPATAEEPPDALLGELEQVDFFLEQGLEDEARALLAELDPAFAEHALVRERWTRLSGPAAEAAAGGEAAVAEEAPPAAVSLDTGAIPAEPLGIAAAVVTPRAVVATGDAPDVSTHGDLGIAYKEMGLFDAAIKEFAALAGDPAREVFALTMIGECYEAKGVPSEALMHYKKALNRPNIKDDEATQLYFQLGRVFQTLGERNEAIYFYEKVSRRNPNFQDVSRRMAALRAEGLASSERAGGVVRAPGVDRSRR